MPGTTIARSSFDGTVAYSHYRREKLYKRIVRQSPDTFSGIPDTTQIYSEMMFIINNRKSRNSELRNGRAIYQMFNNFLRHPVHY